MPIPLFFVISEGCGSCEKAAGEEVMKKGHSVITQKSEEHFQFQAAGGGDEVQVIQLLHTQKENNFQLQA
jgi:hypothetical protein